MPAKRLPPDSLDDGAVVARAFANDSLRSDIASDVTVDSAHVSCVDVCAIQHKGTLELQS